MADNLTGAAIREAFDADPSASAPTTGAAIREAMLGELQRADNSRFVSRVDPIARVQESFAAPLGPSDQTLDQLGFTGPSAILRVPARGTLAVLDAGGRLIDAGAKTVADLAGDAGEGLARAFPGAFSADPRTAGNQLQSDVYNMPAALAGAPATLPPGPVRLMGERNRLLAAPEAPAIAAPANRLAAPAETPMAPAMQSAEAVPAQPVTVELPAPVAAPKRPLLPTITEGSADAQANKLIQHFAQGGSTDVAAPAIPGVQRTLSQATGNAGLAQLENATREAYPQLFDKIEQQNNAARTDYLRGVTGSPEDIEHLKTMRAASTDQLEKAAFTETKPTDPMPVLNSIKETLSGREGQRDVIRTALDRVYNKIVTKDPMTGQLSVQTDPSLLYGIRKDLNDFLETDTGQQAMRELLPIRAELDKVIEAGAPGFGDYIKNYSQASAPIDALKYLQSRNFTDANGRVTLAKVDQAVKQIEKEQATGGLSPSSHVSADQLDALKTLRDDLRAEGLPATVGKPRGSPTFQRLATNRLTETLGNPLVKGLAGALSAGGTHAATGDLFADALAFGAGHAVNKLSARGNDLFQQALINKLIDAQKGSAALRK